jgi:hypothetical protein
MAKAKAAKPARAEDVARLLKEKLGRAPLPQPELIAAEFVACAGGPRAFGKMLWLEYTQAGEGSMVRVRILDIIRAIMKSAQDEQKLSGDDLDHLGDVELTALFSDMGRDLGIEVKFDAGAAAGPAGPAAQDAAVAGQGEAQAGAEGAGQGAGGQDAGGGAGDGRGAAGA